MVGIGRENANPDPERYFQDRSQELDTSTGSQLRILSEDSPPLHKLPPANYIAELSFQKFKTLPKAGKPSDSEWTVLSSIIQFDNVTCESKVIALGAGTKCIGQSKLCPLGLILNDSHAEILARRAFLRYIFHQLKSDSGIFKYDEQKCTFRLSESISFHFFSTQIPCGDACIVSNPNPTETQLEPSVKRRKLESETSHIGDVLPSSSVFTGAKLIGVTNSDPMRQTVGALRIKPGRGDRTLSMSCSDKISKWNVLGLQGGFLDSILEKPIYLKTLNFSCEFDTNSMNRAIYGRWEERILDSTRFVPQKPAIRKTSECQFEYGQDRDKNPSPNGLVWCDIPEDCCPYEVSVNGKKQGITKKAIHSKKSCLRISKLRLLEEFCELLKKYPEVMNKLGIKKGSLNTNSYNDLKKVCVQYYKSWSSVKESYFQQWTTKPNDLLDFNLLSSNIQT